MSTYALEQLSFSGIDEKAAYRLAGLGGVRSYEVDSKISSRGALLDDWQMVIHGVAAEVVNAGADSVRPLQIYGPNNWFGTPQLVQGAVTPFDLLCLTDVEALTIPAQAVREEMARNAAFCAALLKQLAYHCTNTAEMTAIMKWGNPCLRIVGGLALLAESLTSSANGRSKNSFLSVLIPVRQAILARFCGVSRTLFSEYIVALRAANWLRADYGNLEVIDVDVWRRLLRYYREQAVATLTPTLEMVLGDFERVHMSILQESNLSAFGSRTLAPAHCD